MSISYISILLGLLIFAVPVYVMARVDTVLLSRVVKAVMRTVGLMVVVGVLMWALWRVEMPWVSLLWVVVMTLVTAWMLLRRTQLPQRQLLLPVFAGMMVAVLAVGGYLLLVLNVESPLAAKWVVPVSTVLLIHVLPTNIRALSTYFETLRNDSQSYYTHLGNGASRLTALMPYVRQALRSMMEPTASGISSISIFILPSLLAGMLLGRQLPVDAVVLFVLLLIGAVSASVISLLLTLWISDKTVFNKRGELKI